MRHMKYLEKRKHGTAEFPVELYNVHPESDQYVMQCHWHLEYELIAVQRGEIQLTLDEGRVSAVAGDMVLLPEGTLHLGIPHDCVYDCIVFSQEHLSGRGGSGSARELARLRPVESVISRARSPELWRITSELTASLKRRAEAASADMARAEELTVYGLLHQFFGVAMREGRFSSEAMSGNKHTEHLKKVISYIENNYQRELSLSELAEAAGLSAKYLCRIFTAVTERSPIEYLNEYRVECACLMLSETEDQLLDIAYSCGFNDQSYFTKLFKRYKKMTPGEYRKGLYKRISE